MNMKTDPEKYFEERGKNYVKQLSFELRNKKNKDSKLDVEMNKKSNNKNYQVKQIVIPSDLIDAFDQALRQWKMYMTDLARCDLEDLDNIESNEYRRCLRILKKYRKYKYE